ncbi:unnamed protein product [Orchesella dallaii]|uniref:Uncharacterized protein n=1 Tax=Orchesella dallaii TaxID=48710 RepID=A0ABP1QCX5_9HEXA
MSTPLQWFAFKIPFRLYDRILPFPFKWEPTEKRLSSSIPLSGVSRKLIAWIWAGPILFGISLVLFTIQFRILLHLDADKRLGLAYYIRLLAVIINLFSFATISQFSSYYTKNRKEMAALFTGSLEPMASPLELLGAWYLINTKPFYKDFLGGALAGVTFVLGIIAITSPALGIFFDFDSLAPLLPTSFSNINTTFDMIEFLIRVLVRVSFYTVTCVLAARWFKFVLVHLAILLEIGNNGLILIRKYIHLPPPPYRDHLRRNQSLGSQFGIELNAFLISVSLICMTMFMILVSFVSSLAVNSKKIILDIVQMLNGYKVGKRYSRTMRYAEISTPFFSFIGTNYFFLLGIPLEMTMNLALTFSAKVQQPS